jgi:hypothetical protein
MNATWVDWMKALGVLMAVLYLVFPGRRGRAALRRLQAWLEARNPL